jgi:hypothetical protein
MLSGSVGAADYAGGGMSFGRCVHTTAYTGVTFTLAGTTAGCDLLFQLQTYSQQSTANNGLCDSTTTSCFHFPNVRVTVGAAPIVVRFSDLANTGQPTDAAALAAEIVGLQWQLQSAAPPAGGSQQPCAGVSLSIDNVAFTTN